MYPGEENEYTGGNKTPRRKTNMNKRVALIVSVVCLVLISSFTAIAQVPPVNTSATIAANGFPDFIVDSAGLQLGLCNVDNGVDAAGNALGPCLLAPGITNFWAADAFIESADLNERYLVAMSISAIVEPGLKILSNDIVVRLRNKNGLVPGNYTVETPYKNYTLPAGAGQKDIRVVDGVETIISCTGAAACAGVVIPPGPPFAIAGPVFGNLLTAQVGPPAAPAGFVGVGAEIIPGVFDGAPLDAAGPIGGVFRVTDPNGKIVAETTLFSVQGKLFAGAPGVPGVPGAVVPDSVTIQSTAFNARRGILTIRVASTARPRPTFTATANGVGLPVTRAGVIRATTATGLISGVNSITVISSAGGTATFTVTLP
jgi:hypothetical protein